MRWWRFPSRSHPCG